MSVIAIFRQQCCECAVELPSYESGCNDFDSRKSRVHRDDHSRCDGGVRVLRLDVVAGLPGCGSRPARPTF